MFIYKHKPIELETISATQQFGTLHEGWAAFQVIEIKNSTSKAGNPMAEFVLQCVNEDGSTGKVWDRVPLIESWEWKIGAYFKSCAMYEFYKKEEINLETLVNGKGAFILGIDEYNGKQSLKPKEFIYPDKQSTLQELQQDGFNDDIPF